MKRILILMSISLMCFSFTLFSGIEDVVNAMKTGNAAQIARFFDNTVDISMSGKTNNYSKSQGEMVLKDFFATNGVRGFEVIHKGENNGSQYRIGNLITRNGVFRTTVFMKQKGDRQLLQEIRFENK